MKTSLSSHFTVFIPLFKKNNETTPFLHSCIMNLPHLSANILYPARPIPKRNRSKASASLIIRRPLSMPHIIPVNLSAGIMKYSRHIQNIRFFLQQSPFISDQQTKQ